MATTVFVFSDLIASDFERQLCINGMNAPVSLLIAEVKPPAMKRGVTDAGLEVGNQQKIIDLPSSARTNEIGSPDPGLVGFATDNDALCTFNRAQAAAAKRFRMLYELGAVGLNPPPNLLEARIGFAPGGGPSDSRLLWLEAYQRACLALRPNNVAVLRAIIIRGDRLKDFAAARGISPSVASGMLI